MKFLFAFVGVLCAHALALDEDEITKELKANAKSINDTWNVAVVRTSLRSTLFETCIDAANTRKMQYLYIQDPAQGIEFMKYEVSRFEKGRRPVNWEREIQCKDIIDCSRAAKDYLMFQYNGTTCRMVNRTYVDTRGKFCFELEGYKKDVVYVNTAATPSGCPVNTDVLVVDSGTKSIGGTTLEVPTTKIMASSSCIKHYGGSIYSGSGSVPFTTIRDFLKNKKSTPSGCPVNTDVLVVDSGTKCIGGTTLEVPTAPVMALLSCMMHYGGSVYSANSSVSFNTIRNFLRNKKYQGNICIRAQYSSYDEKYQWTDYTAIDDSYFAVKPQEPRFQELLVISSSHDYLLVPLNNSELVTDFLCFGDPSG